MQGSHFFFIQPMLSNNPIICHWWWLLEWTSYLLQCWLWSQTVSQITEHSHSPGVRLNLEKLIVYFDSPLLLNSSLLTLIDISIPGISSTALTKQSFLYIHLNIGTDFFFLLSYINLVKICFCLWMLDLFPFFTR